MDEGSLHLQLVGVNESIELPTANDLVAAGYDEEVIARLPVRHCKPDGTPYWHRYELLDLLELARREVRGE